jgi:hypothetical protein
MEATTALRNIAAIQAAKTDGPDDGGRHRFLMDRMDHYRRFPISESEVQRLAMEDLRTRF